jgi:hypothetical protein
MKAFALFTYLAIWSTTTAALPGPLPDASSIDTTSPDNQTIVHIGVEHPKRGCVYLSGTVTCSNIYYQSGCGLTTCPIAGHKGGFTIDQGKGGGQGYFQQDCGGKDSVCAGACADDMNNAHKFNKQWTDPAGLFESSNPNYPATQSQFRIDPDSFMSVFQGGHIFGCKPDSSSWTNKDGTKVSCRYGYNVC